MDRLAYGKEYNPSKGDIVKIRRRSKNFWLKVTHITRNKIYTIVNNAVFNKPLNLGDVLIIDKSEIIYGPNNQR